MRSEKPASVPYSKGGFTKLTLSIASSLTKLSHQVQNLMTKTIADEGNDRNEMLQKFNSSGRIDYVLQEQFLENAYLSAIKAHTAYWSDVDVCVFICKELQDKK